MSDAEYKISGSQRIAAAVLSSVIFIVMLFSVWFVAEESHHDCTGENCSICACLSICSHSLRQLGGGISFSAANTVSVIFFTLTLVLFIKQVFISGTLVSQKVRFDE